MSMSTTNSMTETARIEAYSCRLPVLVNTNERTEYRKQGIHHAVKLDGYARVVPSGHVQDV